jgi:radical SAM superfamily enzyme YgiQ (UPF0313 family)
MAGTPMPRFEIGPIRPPSEGGGNSLLVRVTRNCPWGRCKFCYGTLYGREKFQLRPVTDIKADIGAMAHIADAIKGESRHLGHGGAADQATAAALLQSDPTLSENAGFITVFNWLASGAATAFLQDADSLIMKSDELVEVVRHLKGTFPSLQRITSYARTKTIHRKSDLEMKSLREAGLMRLHMGLETGDDELLGLTDKGVTAQEHIAAARKARDAGFQLSLYVMPDLGGRALSRQHAVNTASVLNAIDPDYIRFRPFIPRAGTPMYDDYVAGKFELSSPHERLREIRTMVENLTVTSRLCFDHFGNSWYTESGLPLFSPDYEGYPFPSQKSLVLGLIDEGIATIESRHIPAKDIVSLERL